MSKKSENELIEEVAARLVAKFAGIPAGRVATAVDDAHGRFEAATIRDFIPLLVERRVSDELSSQAAAPGEHARDLAFV